jgi:hypothetical protein
MHVEEDEQIDGAVARSSKQAAVRIESIPIIEQRTSLPLRCISLCTVSNNDYVWYQTEKENCNKNHYLTTLNHVRRLISFVPIAHGNLVHF